ncbi:hypothetical protein [Aliiglaciecola sp. LCG003]|uniref:hypothetical protein n=1 Tax=Aliiglaciecola sp. LCG003 TaxID=3053655 RepID=UPI002572E19A|nr:hypothetical protein [Aliiglaciecola sp. LCG003]WJG09892.1 hypothetical protein QR722_02325 [Aliiglaciecola sp. LCG003]
MFDAVLFGMTVLAFVVGMSCIIMGFIPSPANGLKEKIEYGYFGVSGLAVAFLFALALMWH